MERTKRREASSGSKKETAIQERKDASPSKSFFAKVIAAAYQGQDPASLGIMRFLFGLLMALDIPQERGMANLPKKWSDPDACFFPLFDWMRPLPLDWMYMLYVVMFVAAVGIMLGLFYRLSCCCFVLTYWYVFFMDKTSWNNHSYLYGLTGSMLLLTNAHHYWSVDAWMRPSIRNVEIPRWHYGLIKLQFFLVYFYAGLKKLDMDWVKGYSMTGLSRKWVFDPLRLAGLPDDFIDHYVVHISGLILDLSQGFFLYFDRTRPIAFVNGGLFHLMNSQMFHIGMFPWTMMATMPIFCYPDWPKKLLRRLPGKLLSLFTTKEAQANVVCSNAKKGMIPISQMLLITVAALYASVQFVMPYSHGITKGYNAWTQGLYGYSWDMMVHSWSTQHVVVKVVDGSTGKTTYLKPGAFTPSTRNRRWSAHPDMLKQYAVCLSKKIKALKQLDIQQPRIYFDIWRSLNKRFQQRLVDPNVDMVAADWSPFRDSPWLRPLLTGLTPWRERLNQIKSDTYKKSNLTDVTFVADFPGLFLENYIDQDVIANITVLYGSLKVEFDGTNKSLGLNDSIQVPRNTTHIVYVTSATPACYMYESYNVTWENSNATFEGADSDAEFLHMAKENLEWKSKTAIGKFKKFMQKKMNIFRIAFENSAMSFKHILARSKLLDK